MLGLLGVFVLYVALSLFFFGGPILRSPSHVAMGHGNDPKLFAWMLAWWPHAIGEGLNPLYSRLLFAPEGANMMWTTSIPGPSLVLAPITLAAGPLVSYNVLALLAPALNGSTAFLLCRHVTKRIWPSVVGGFIFGFSDYTLATLLGHPHLSLVALLPLFVLLVLRRLEGSLAPRRFVVLLSVTLVSQFLISTEVLLTLTMFGGFALLVGLAFPEPRRPLVRTAGLIASAYAALAVIVSPLIYYTLFKPGSHPKFVPEVFSADLSNFIFPTGLTQLGSGASQHIARTYLGNHSEQGAYLGIPLLLIVVLFAAQRFKRAGTKRSHQHPVAGALMALGPRVHVNGVAAGTPMPWEALTHVPLARYALPGRVVVYMFLALAVIVALWLSREPRPGRWLLAALGIAVILPNGDFHFYHFSYSSPPFITHDAYRGKLSARDRVLTIPFGSTGMLWQAQTRMAFALAGGYAQHLPDSYAGFPIIDSFGRPRLQPSAKVQLQEFLAAKRVTAIVIDKRFAGGWPPLLAQLHLSPKDVGGVLLYRLRRP
jgi:hypothetical protein